MPEQSIGWKLHAGAALLKSARGAHTSHRAALSATVIMGGPARGCCGLIESRPAPSTSFNFKTALLNRTNGILYY
jgi:hypothetical protein